MLGESGRSMKLGVYNVSESIQEILALKAKVAEDGE
jgi:hypothetical protein